MTTPIVASPGQVPKPIDGRADRMLAALVTYVERHQFDHGGSHLRTALLAVLLADRHHIPPGEAADTASYGAFDDRIRDAGAARDALLVCEAAKRTAAEYDADDLMREQIAEQVARG